MGTVNLTLYERPGIGDVALTFVDGTVIEFVGGGDLQQATAATGTFVLPARDHALTLPPRILALTLEDRP